MPQRFMQSVPRKNKIRIKTHVGTVEAPLPDNFSSSFGSTYSAPFEADLLSGTLGKIAVASGTAPKVGISTTKFYSSPEPTEISLELEFNAYYDAREEVFIPAARLVIASLGIETTYEEMKAEMAKLTGTISDMAGFGSNDDSEGSTESVDSAEIEEGAQDLSEFVGFLRGPDKPSIINFGNVMTLEEVYISSATPQFSNIVDSAGYPMSAVVSVTATMRKSPTANDMAKAFRLGSIGQGSLTSAFPPKED